MVDLTAEERLVIKSELDEVKNATERYIDRLKTTKGTKSSDIAEKEFSEKLVDIADTISNVLQGLDWNEKEANAASQDVVAKMVRDICENKIKDNSKIIFNDESITHEEFVKKSGKVLEEIKKAIGETGNKKQRDADRFNKNFR